MTSTTRMRESVLTIEAGRCNDGIDNGATA
jgi:hypothetical protein